MLASLTIDLTLGLAKFESDSGRAAQIVTRDSERMTRAARAVAAAIDKQQDAMGRTATEALAIQAAQAGLVTTAAQLATAIERSNVATASAGSGAAAGYTAAGVAAVQSVELQKSKNTELIRSIIQVQQAYETQRKALIASNESGALPTDQLRPRLTSLSQNRDSAIRDLKDADNQRIAAAAADLAGKKQAALALATAQAGSVAATAAAQSQVYLAFMIAMADAAEKAAAAEAHQATVTAAIADASARSAAEQREAYATKTAYIAKVNEEAAALFRTRDAQRELDALRAGVGAQQAAQLAKFGGDRAFTATIYEAIEAERKFAAEFGKTATEIFKQDAAQRGLTNTTASAIDRFEALAASNQKLREAAASTKGNAAYLADLQRQIDVSTKTRSELVAMDLAQRGLTDQGAPLLARLRELESATGQLGKGANITRNNLLTLKYTLSDVIASAASGISPLTILLQQGGQVAQVEGGIGGVLKTITSLVTPARLAIGALGATVGVVSYAFYEGSRQSKAFADAMVLTGGYVGKTEGQFNSLARNIAASGQVTVGVAREFGEALAATGQVGPRVIESATAAAAKFGAATGASAVEVAKDYATMGQDVAKWAAEHNRQLNFISAAQYDQIKSLADNGRAAEAQALVYDALNKRFDNLHQNLGTIEKTLKSVKGEWSRFWDAAYDVGRAETIEDVIKRAESAAAALGKRLTDGRAANPAFSSAPTLRNDPANDPAERTRVLALQAAASEQAVEYKRLKITQESAVLRQAENAATTQRVIDGKALVAQYRDEAKGVTEYQTKLKALQSLFSDAERIGNPFTPEAQNEALAGLKKKFTDSAGVNETDAQRKKQLEQDLKFLQDNLAREKDALQFGQQELQAIYASGTISLQEFYDRRAATIAAGVQKELNELTDEQARLEVELQRGDLKGSERIETQTKLNDVTAKAANITRDAANAAKLANHEQELGLKGLAERVNEYRANLFAMAGDELKAAQIRQQAALVAAARISIESGGAITQEDVALAARLTEQTVRFAEVQRQAGIVTANAARAEDAYLYRALQDNISLKDQEEGVYLLRSASLVQLGELRDKARELADASTDPRIKAYADDLALSYAKAADAIDPAIQRIRAATDDLASSMGSTFQGIFGNLQNLGRNRVQDAQKDVDTQRKAYDDQIKALRDYLAQATDAKTRAAYQDQINALQKQRDNTSVDRFEVARKTIERDVLGPLLKEIQNTATKVLVTDPINDLLKKSLREFTTGSGGFADSLRSLIGGNRLTVDRDGAGINVAAADYSPAKDSQAASDALDVLKGSVVNAASSTVTQTAATQTATSALAALTAAAQAAAAALSSVSGSSGFSGFASAGGSSTYSGTTAGIDYSGIGFPLADGTNRVPYDGFQATLHKNEAVVPAKFNPAAGGVGMGGGLSQNITVHNTAGDVVQATASKNSDGDIEVLVRKIVRDETARDMRTRSGPISTSLKAAGVPLHGGNPRRT